MLVPIMITSWMLLATPAAAVDGSEPVTTVAGGNGTGRGIDQFDNPVGIAVDTDGTLFVVDRNNHRVQRIATDGTITTVAGGNRDGNGVNQLDKPFGITIDAAGTLYIADEDNDRVQRVTADGTVTTVAGTDGRGSGTNQLAGPTGIAVDEQGALYIAEQDLHRVKKVAADGTVSIVAGSGGRGSGPDQLAFPVDVALDAAGSLYIVDASNHRVQKVAIDGTVTTVADLNYTDSEPHQHNSPWGIAVEADGTLYIADTLNQRVRRVTVDGTTTTVGGLGGWGPGNLQLNKPFRVTLDASGSLYISDSGNERVQKLTAHDTTAPTITVSTPVDHQIVANGAALNASFVCADIGTSGLRSCDATLDQTPIANGGTINTMTAGSNTLTVTAVDRAGNNTTATVTFTVNPASQPEPQPDPDPVPGPEPGPVTHTIADAATIDELVRATDFRPEDADILRLYTAFFSPSRPPDVTGAQYWIDIARNGHTVDEIAGWFAESTEFTLTYGNVDDRVFLSIVYTNVLGRSYEQAGFDYWLSEIHRGLSRGGVVRWVAANDEFINAYPFGAA